MLEVRVKAGPQDQLRLESRVFLFSTLSLLGSVTGTWRLLLLPVPADP